MDLQYLWRLRKWKPRLVSWVGGSRSNRSTWHTGWKNNLFYKQQIISHWAFYFVHVQLFSANVWHALPLCVCFQGVRDPSSGYTKYHWNITTWGCDETESFCQWTHAFNVSYFCHLCLSRGSSVKQSEGNMYIPRNVLTLLHCYGTSRQPLLLTVLVVALLN